MNYNNHNITAITYNGHTIKKVYSCNGELVFGEESTGIKMEYQYSNGTSGTVDCNGDPVLTSGDTNHQIVRTSDTPCYRWAIIGDCVTEIGDSAFEEETCLTAVTLPSTLTKIGKLSFADSCLPTINIPSGVTSIGASAFAGCTSLTSINIPSGVRSIASSLLYNCVRLTSIDVPSGVTSLGISSFGNCSGLTSITFHSVTPPEIFASSFKPFEGTTCPIYVPAESVEAYKTAINWREYADKIFPIQ